MWHQPPEYLRSLHDLQTVVKKRIKRIQDTVPDLAAPSLRVVWFRRERVSIVGTWRREKEEGS
jgi:hypothetical protein